MAEHERPLWTAPPRLADIPEEDVLIFRNTVKAAAEFALQGRGEGLRAQHNRERAEIPKLTTLEDNVEAYKWNKDDLVLLKLTEEGRKRAIKQVLSAAYRTRKSRKDENDVLDVMPPAEWPERARDYFDDFRKGPLRQFENWIRSLPSELKQNPKEFYTVEFWTAMEEMGQTLFLDSLIRKYAMRDPQYDGQEIPREAEKIVTPLPYALSVIASEKATRSIRGERGWPKKLIDRTRDLPIIRHVPLLGKRRIESMGVGEQYVKASGVIAALRAKRAEKKGKPHKNKFQVTLGDAATWSVADEAFRGGSLDDIVQPFKIVASYTPNGDKLYETLTTKIAENARRAGMDMDKYNRSIPEDTVGTSERLEPLAKLQKRLDNRKKKMKKEDRVKRNEGFERSAKILTMIHAHDIAAQQYNNVIAKLTKHRTPPAKDEDPRNEGLLYLHDGQHLIGFESRMNQPDAAGTIFSMVYHKKDDFYAGIRMIGGLPLFGTFGLRDPEQIERASKYLEGPQKSIVRGNPTGKLTKIIVIEGGTLLAKEGLKRLRDRQLYYNFIDGAWQIGTQAFTNLPGLIADVMKESDVPDNPNKCVTDVSDNATKALARLRLPYVRPNPAEIWLSSVQLSLDDMIHEEDAVASQAALGAIHVRRGYWEEAKYFLGMAENWSAFAEKEKNYDPHWRIFTHYQRSFMFSKRNMPKEHADELLEAFLIAQKAKTVPMPTDLTSVEQMEAHVVRYPMQYKDRLTYLYALKDESPEEALAIAQGTTKELETILSLGGQYDKERKEDKHILTPERRGEIDGLIGKYKRFEEKYATRSAEPRAEPGQSPPTQQPPATAPVEIYQPPSPRPNAGGPRAAPPQSSATSPAATTAPGVVVLPPRQTTDISDVIDISPLPASAEAVADPLAWPAALRTWVPEAYAGVNLDDPNTYGGLQKDYRPNLDKIVQ